MNRKYPGSLHNHTDWSNIRLRDSINKLDELINYAIELGHDCVAITEHETVANAITVEKAWNKIKESHPGFKVIRGNEIYLCRNGLNNKTWVPGQDRYYHFILLARDAEGHKQIREISSKAWMRSYMARGMRRVPTYYQDLKDIISVNKGHVVGSTACLGGCLPTQLLRYKESNDETLLEKIKIWILQMDDIFGHGNFYLELQPSNNSEQIYVNKKLLEFSKEFDIPYIVTTDSHYLKKEDASIHKAYLNSQNGDREVDSFYATTYMMSTEEIESYLTYLTPEELEKAYENIKNIADSCENYSLCKPLRIPSLKWKEFEDFEIEKWYDRIPMLETFMNSDFDGDRLLCKAILEGIKEHPDLQNKEAYDEINSNLDMTWVSSTVNNAHWSAYYLNLQKIIDVCWEANSLVGPGRGSGVGFVLLYVLGITQINPLAEKTKTFAWRFLNPERVSVLDVDFDIEGGRRADVLKAFRKEYGEDRVANVATYRTEKSKSAILTACRGLGIDVDIAQYLSSLVPADRGMLRTLSQCFYGDEENDFPPIRQFVIEMSENYPEIWDVAQKIEGLICGSGVHAGGVIFVDEPFTESTALMRAPDGTICTQFELHDAEAVSLIKYDALSVEAMDKIHNCIDLICEYGFFEKKATLKETYEEMIGVYKIERDDPGMWRMVWNHDILSLFQMEKQSGIQGIATLKPTSVDDLAILNSTIRLMAQEKGGEMPTTKLARFKAHPQQWDEEMRRFGLGQKEKDILSPVLGMSYGLCIAQEQFMELVQLPELGGFSLTWADKLRKSIAKKNPAEYDKLTKEFYEVTSEKGIDQKFAHYVWDVLIAMSKGYGFNQSHTLAYSLIALQEMNLAYKYPILFWNCACLISDSGGMESVDEDSDEIEYVGEIEEYYEELEEFGADDDEDDIVDSYDEEDTEIVTLANGKKKKKLKTTNYGKIAAAIGKMKSAGVEVSLPSINDSIFTFSPDIENNQIRYGLSGISRINEDLIKEIIENRPYGSLDDFMGKIKVNKLQMINLIKSGAFDEFDDRLNIMKNYILSVSDQKKRCTMQNLNMLIEFDLIPKDEYEFPLKVFNFTKWIKQCTKSYEPKQKEVYVLESNAMRFYEQNFNIDLITMKDGGELGQYFVIKQSDWKKIYDREVSDKIRPYVQKNKDMLLEKMNERLFNDTWNKYCLGTISSWEMDSVSFYAHEHELINLDMEKYGISNYFDLPQDPRIDRFFTPNGKSNQVPLYKIERIAGTVLDRDKNKKTITLLTTDGVVTVKMYGPVFANYDKQISQKGVDGKKHVIEKSWFGRGNKIMVCGIKRDDSFMAKKYNNTPWHLCELITSTDEYGNITTKGEREEV